MAFRPSVNPKVINQEKKLRGEKRDQRQSEQTGPHYTERTNAKCGGGIIMAEKEKTHRHTQSSQQIGICRFFLLLRKEKNVLSAPTVDGFFFVSSKNVFCF